MNSQRTNGWKTAFMEFGFNEEADKMIQKP